MVKPVDLLFKGGTVAFLIYLLTLTAGNQLLLATLGLAGLGWALLVMNKISVGLVLYGIGIAAFFAMFAVLPALWPFVIVLISLVPILRGMQ